MKGRKNLKTRLISGMTTVLLLVALVACVFFTLQSLSVGHISFGGISVFRVVTGSMEPEISVGALLAAKKVDIQDVAVKDIVCYRAEASGLGKVVITHRVVGIQRLPNGNTVLQTKGDANITEDANCVSEAQLIGRVIWHTGDGSTMAQILQFLTSDFGFLACILLPVVLIAIWICRDAVKSMKKAVAAVEQQLQEQEKKARQAAALSEQEYAQMYDRIAKEVRKELEQDAAQSVEPEQTDLTDACGAAAEISPAATDTKAQ